MNDVDDANSPSLWEVLAGLRKCVDSFDDRLRRLEIGFDAPKEWSPDADGEEPAWAVYEADSDGPCDPSDRSEGIGHANARAIATVQENMGGLIEIVKRLSARVAALEDLCDD